MPAEIGLAAERVLTGCLDTNVANRWTIAMVDEVAWGIGWASHDSSPASDPEADCDCDPIPNRTRTISVISDPDSPSNSCSSMSEEPPFPGPRSRGSRSSSRSSSPSGLPRTLRYTPVSLSSLTDSILGTDTMRGSSTPSLLTRGRPRTKVSPERGDSRSLSLSMAPLTPSDLIDGSITRTRRPRSYGADSSLERELGRTRGTSRLRWRGFELDDIEEMSAREKWSAPGSRHSSRSRFRDDGSHGVARRAFDLLNQWEESPRGRSSRAGSQPPRYTSSVSREKRLHETDRDWACRNAPSSAMWDGVRGGTVVVGTKVRSRSVGFEFGVERARTRKLAPL
jgi:MAP/microtubule affinity-regulating kinase